MTYGKKMDMWHTFSTFSNCDLRALRKIMFMEYSRFQIVLFYLDRLVLDEALLYLAI